MLIKDNIKVYSRNYVYNRQVSTVWTGAASPTMCDFTQGSDTEAVSRLWHNYRFATLIICYTTAAGHNARNSHVDCTMTTSLMTSRGRWTPTCDAEGFDPYAKQTFGEADICFWSWCNCIYNKYVFSKKY